MTYKILEYVKLYPVLARYRFKKDIPKHIQGLPIDASFGLWGRWWIIRGLNGLVTSDGGEMPYHECLLIDGPAIIGRRDLAAADRTAFAEAWRESLQAKIEEKLALALAKA